MDIKKLVTKISDISIDDFEIKEEINIDNLSTIIHDFDYDEDFRLKAFNFYYIKFDEGIIEIINKLSMMYLLSKSKLLESFITKICLNSIIPFNFKLELAKNFEHYDVLDKIIQLSFTRVAVPCVIEAIFVLMKSKKYIKKSKIYFCKIVNNKELECHYRYKTILSIEIRVKKSLQKLFLKDIMTSFIRCKTNNIRYRILAGQYLLQKCKTNTKIKDEILRYLKEFMLDSELDYNIRADVADVLLNLGDEQTKSISKRYYNIVRRKIR